MLLPEIRQLPEDDDVEVATTPSLVDSCVTDGDARLHGSAGSTRSPRRRTVKWSLVGVAALVLSLVSGAGGAWAASAFTDVPPNHPFRDEITWAASHGIAKGYPDGTFRPSDDVSRQAAVAFISRYNDQIEVVEVNGTTSAGYSWTAVPTCPAGKRPIAGGGRLDTPDTVLTDSFPSGQTWYSQWVPRGAGTGPAGTFSAYAICAPEPT